MTPAVGRHPRMTRESHARHPRFLASERMAVGAGGRRAVRDVATRAHDVRRLRDLLRAAVLADGFVDGQLPAENELMAAYRATRATVREALALLRGDGLIARLPGVGTHVAVRPPRTGMDEAHGVTDGGALYTTTTPPRILDRSRVPAPPSLAAALGVAPGTECLRLEYVGMADGAPVVVATNYVLFPEADRILATPFHGHWYQLMADAGVPVGGSEFVIDATAADPVSAALLDIAPGAPLLAVEQTITSPHGRVVDIAFLRVRPDRMRFLSRASAPGHAARDPLAGA
jgi:GntR family transcriptional regulator